MRTLQYFTEQTGGIRKRLEDLGVYKKQNGAGDRGGLFATNKQGKFLKNPKHLIYDNFKDQSFLLYSISKSTGNKIEDIEAMTINQFIRILTVLQVEDEKRKSAESKIKR